MLEELERVRAYRGDVTEPDTATTLAARAELLEVITNAAPRTDRTPKRRKAQRRRRLVLAGGLAAAGVAIAGVLGFHTAAAPQSALARQMNQLARVAASQDWTGIPGPGQYLYTQSEGLTEADTGAAGKECTIQLVDRRAIWTATDGSGALDETFSDGRFTSAADASVCASMHVTESSENVSGGNREPAGGLTFPTNNWKSLSTSPPTLLKQVHQLDGGPDTPAEWFVNVTDFMRESDVPPAIRAALYQALPLIPGVRLLGPQTDSVGQSGLGVGFYKDGQLDTKLIFNQQTGRLLYEGSYGATGTVVDWTAYTAQKIVNSVPNYPLDPANPPDSSGTSTVQQAPPTTTTP